MTEGRAVFLKVFEGLFKCGALFVFFFLLNGCAGLSGTEKHYEHLNGSLSVFDDPTLIQWNKDPKLIVTDDMLAESDALVKKGYRLIGRSGHIGAYGEQEAVLEKARLVGAEVAVYQSSFYDRVEETLVIPLPDNKTVITNVSGVVNTSSGKELVYGTATTVIPGTQDLNIPLAWDRFLIRSQYYAKNKPWPLGVMRRDLTEDEKRDPFTRGVIVTLVIAGSPAEKVGIKEGDSLFSVNGEKIENAEHSIAIFEKYAGQKVRMIIVSNNKYFLKRVQLNP